MKRVTPVIRDDSKFWPMLRLNRVDRRLSGFALSSEIVSNTILFGQRFVRRSLVKRIFDSLGDRLSISYESGERKKFRACAASGFHPQHGLERERLRNGVS